MNQRTRTCTIDGCDNDRKYRLYCQMHYSRARANGGDPGPAGLLREPTDGQCSVSGCCEKVRSKGLCSVHYDRLRRTGSVDRPGRIKPPCSVDGCVAEFYAKGYCGPHYHRNLRTGSPHLPEPAPPSRCVIDGCEKPVSSRDLCPAHYRRLRTYGSPTGKPSPREPRPLAARFWEHVQPGSEDECWEWQGTRNRQGYGVLVAAGRKQMKAHRVSLMVHGEDLPADMFACHHCDNPPCVNPKHLYVGTPLDNGRDASQRNRLVTGERHHLAVLTETAVREIRQAWASKTATRAVLAERYNVSESAINHVVNDRVWRNV